MGDEVMSWEEFITYRNCECGKGRIKIITRMDDWNRNETSEIILCEECMEKYRQEREYENKRKIKFEKQKEEILDYFNKKYLDIWVNYFKDIKTKKGVWQIVHKAGIENQSLSTFYDHWRWASYTTSEYVIKLVKFDTVDKIMDTLNIEDNKFNNMLKQPLEYHNEMERKRYNEAYLSIRKKR